MNKTKRVAAIGLLCIGTSALSFGDIFQTIGANDWDETYNANTALFSAVFEQGGYNLQSGFPSAGATIGGTVANNAATPFTLTYDPTTAQATATLTVGEDGTLSIPALTLSLAGGGFDHLGIALSTGAGDEVITISDITLNGDANGGSLTTNGQGLFDFAMTPPTDLTQQESILKGTINISWTGNTPDSLLSATIVGADAVAAPTPEPGTWALVGSALVGLGLLRRKRIV
jgi:PEP-CTERM motif